MGRVTAGGRWSVQLVMLNANSLEWRGTSNTRHLIYIGSLRICSIPDEFLSAISSWAFISAG